MEQKHFENIKIIVNENNDMPITRCRSSVGIKYTVNGIIDGLFLGFEKPTLTVAEVVEAVNQLLKEMINEQAMKETELKPMKAWLVTGKEECNNTVVFAETRGKARSIAMSTDCCEDEDFLDIEVRRAPQIDKYYKKGKVEMDWENPKDRIALVKELSFRCDYSYLEWEDCESCPAKKYCDAYQDHLTEEGADNEQRETN